MQQWKEYEEKNKERFLNELLELLRIPSVSARSEHKPDMQKCAEAMKQRLLEAGADKAEIYPTKGHPIVVSMGDVAASGGYFISCDANEIYADATTITGSIGVFSIIPNLQLFFKDKLGVTFDGVKTAPYADEGNMGRPLSAQEKMFMQASVDTIYETFKSRVAGGTKALGWLTSLTLITGTITNLVLLPVLIYSLKRKEKK